MVSRHLCELGLRELEVGQALTEHLARWWRAARRFVERSPCEAQRGGGHGGAKDVERAHRDLEAFAAGRRCGCASGTRQFVKRSLRQWVRRDDLDALGDLEARGAGFDDEGRDPARARRLAAADEDHVEVGDAAVGDPGLLAVQHGVIAVDACAAQLMAATSEPASGSDSAKAAIASPRATLRQVPCRLLRPASRPALMAPEPRPCIAKAKSARPEWRASVSRVRQIARVSICLGRAAVGRHRRPHGCNHPPAHPAALTRPNGTQRRHPCGCVVRVRWRWPRHRAHAPACDAGPRRTASPGRRVSLMRAGPFSCPRTPAAALPTNASVGAA